MTCPRCGAEVEEVQRAFEALRGMQGRMLVEPSQRGAYLKLKDQESPEGIPKVVRMGGPGLTKARRESQLYIEHLCTGAA